MKSLNLPSKIEKHFIYNEVKLKNFCRKLCKNLEDSEDLAQDTAIRAIEKQHLWDGKNTPAWLCTIAYHLYLDNKTKEKRRKENQVLFDQERSWTRGTQTSFGFDESFILTKIDAIRKVKQLPEEFKFIMEKRMQEATWKEIKEILEGLNIKLGTINSRTDRAKSKMKSLMTVDNI